MSIRGFLLPILLLGGHSWVMAAPMNVLLIAVDDLRPEIGAYGVPHIHTPELDKLAASGRLFQHHYVAVPTCGASRHAMLTGRRPRTFQDTTNAASEQLPEEIGVSPESVADLLRRNGWWTVGIGKISHSSDGYVWKDNAPASSPDYREEVEHAEFRHSWNELVVGHSLSGFRHNPIFAYGDGSTRDPGDSPAYEIGVNVLGESLPDTAYPDGLIARDAVDRLEAFQESGQPFFLAVGFLKPHLPFNSPKAYWDLYDRNALPSPDPATPPVGADPDTVQQSGEPGGGYAEVYENGAPAGLGDAAYRRLLRHGYYASISYVDAQIGKVLKALEDTGLDENTLVILWADHGWCLDDYGLLGKHLVLERGVHAPLIIRAPGQPKPGVPTSGIVETVDLYPTIADYCGIPVPGSVDGVSLRPMVDNPTAAGKGWAYSRQLNTLQQDSVRTADWRLIRNGSNMDLYDLNHHPFELEDVSTSQPAVLQDLRDTKLNAIPQRDGVSYADFQEQYFTVQQRYEAFWTGALIDADGDGWRNLEEAAAGTSPVNPLDHPGREEEVVTVANEPAWRVVVDRNLSGVYTRFLRSPTLQVWQPVTGDLPSEALPDGRERVSVLFGPLVDGLGFSARRLTYTDPAEVILEETFDGDHAAGLAAVLLADPHLELAPGKGVGGTHALKCTYVPSSNGSERVIREYPFPGGEQVRQATLSFDVRFEEGFEFVLGGKLHGLAPLNKVTGGGTRVPEGWSARVMWREQGRGQTYLYDQEDEVTFGVGSITDKPVFQAGAWHHVTLQVSLNDEGASNGWSRLLVNGVPVMDTRQVEFRGLATQESAIRKFLFSTFYGGSTTDWSPSRPMVAWFDNFRVRRGISESFPLFQP